MNLLLDTCTFLWVVEDSPRMSDKARHLFRDPSNAAYLSSVSAWEITVKFGLGRLKLDRPPQEYVPHQRALHHLVPLPLEEDAALQLHRLPPLHRDPFDRMLICQGMYHGLVIVTPDPDIRQYPLRTEW